MLESQRERKPSQHWSFLRQNVRESPSAALAYCAAACRVYQITANANVSSDVVAAGGGIMPPRIPTSHFVHHQRIRAYVHALPMLINVCVFFGVGASEARKRSCAPADYTYTRRPGHLTREYQTFAIHRSCNRQSRCISYAVRLCKLKCMVMAGAFRNASVYVRVYVRVWVFEHLWCDINNFQFFVRETRSAATPQWSHRKRVTRTRALLLGKQT